MKRIRNSLLLAGVLALVPLPAQAAPEIRRESCTNHTAVVKLYGKAWSASNPCRGLWLAIGTGWNDSSDSDAEVVFVAPKTKFAKTTKHYPAGDWVATYLTREPEFCGAVVVTPTSKFADGACE